MAGNFAEILDKGFTGYDIVLFGRHMRAFRKKPGHSETPTLSAFMEIIFWKSIYIYLHMYVNKFE
jgi:hypothetical protein